jgi:hypothetical protein
VVKQRALEAAPDYLNETMDDKHRYHPRQFEELAGDFESLWSEH